VHNADFGYVQQQNCGGLPNYTTKAGEFLKTFIKKLQYTQNGRY
jgi:hypothetical protein